MSDFRSPVYKKCFKPDFRFDHGTPLQLHQSRVQRIRNKIQKTFHLHLHLSNNIDIFIYANNID